MHPAGLFREGHKSYRELDLAQSQRMRRHVRVSRRDDRSLSLLVSEEFKALACKRIDQHGTVEEAVSAFT
jgi:hypothetical protein